jgi:llaJI restriction endonuclease
MKLLIEEHDYPVESVKKLFPNIDELDPVDGIVRVNYVGYYYNAAEGESVFILPKVVLDKENGKVFGSHRPEDIIDLEADGSPLSKVEREFIYSLSVWVYRAIAVYRQDCKISGRDHTIIRHQNIVRQGHGRKRTANTYLDILLSLIDFAKQNRDWFMFVIKNIHSGFNKINWTRTIAKSQMVIQDDAPIYLDPVNKKRMVNFDEELLVIFFSILNYIHTEYGFPVETNIKYDLITGKKFEQYLNKGLGIRRLRQIKYKYFSDKALELWDLCFAFFEQSKQIRIASQMNEFLLAKDFNIVFEVMIDELIGDHTFPDRLNKKQDDGKEVDHLFLWDSLTRTHREDETRKGDHMTYYIGDSKYYKQKNRVGTESVAKQFTYARNVIQWNLNLFFGENADEERIQSDFCLRDNITEGYNIIPNFFISGTIPEDLSYCDNIDITGKSAKTFASRQYINRLFDRDTLLVTHYDVNFLFVLSLYARDNAMQKKQWRNKVRNIFRDKIREELSRRYTFSAMRALPGINSEQWLKEHFADILGKVFAPYSEDKGIIALALSNPDIAENASDRALIVAENAKVIALVDSAFHREQLPNLGTDHDHCYRPRQLRLSLYHPIRNKVYLW